MPAPAYPWLSAVVFADGSSLVLRAADRRWQVHRDGAARGWHALAGELGQSLPESVADGAPGRRAARVFPAAPP